jgi:membrane protein
MADNPFQLAAALAYYTIFSLVPLLLIVIAIAGLVVGQEATERQVLTTLQGFVGPNGAQAIQAMLRSANSFGSGVLATVLCILTLALGASGGVGQLHQALNTVWEVEAKSGNGLLGLLRERFVSFSMILGLAFLLLVSLVVSAILTAAVQALSGWLPGGELLWHSIEFLVSLGLITLLFALIYKILPDARIAWRDVWIGAAMTALLFTVGKFLIGLYLGHSSMMSAYGAAGSLVVILVWVYYSALILFFGAEFTQVYANTLGSGVAPDEHAGPKEEPQPVVHNNGRA